VKDKDRYVKSHRQTIVQGSWKLADLFLDCAMIASLCLLFFGILAEGARSYYGASGNMEAAAQAHDFGQALVQVAIVTLVTCILLKLVVHPRVPKKLF